MEKQKIKLIIFDYDGVLVDSVSANSRAFVKALMNLGFEVNPSDFIIGNSLKEQLQYVMEKYQIQASYEEFKSQFENIVKKESKKIKFRKEFIDLIEDLSREFTLAIASNNSRDNIINILSANGVEDCFDKITGIGKGKKFQGASKKETLEEVLNSLDFSAKQALLIDDIPKHIRVAHSMGFKTIAFVYKENKHMDFPEYACLANSASEVKKCILNF